MSAISPELALVDPELAARARGALPEPGCFRPSWRDVPVAPGRRPPTPAATHIAPATPIARSTARSRKRSSAGTTALVVLAAALSTGVVAGLLERARPEAASARPAGETAAATARAARTHVWSAVPGVDAYRVTLLRDDQQVYRTTTSQLALTIPQGLELLPGRYTMTVESAGIPDSGSRGPLVESTFVVAD